MRISVFSHRNEFRAVPSINTGSTVRGKADALAKERRKFLFVIPDYGSFNNFLSDLAKRLLDEGNGVILISSSRKVINVEDRIDFRAYQNFRFYDVDFPRGFRLFGYLKTAKAIKNIVEAEDPDLIHAHFSGGILALALAKNKGFPTSLATFHGMNATVSKGISKLITTPVEYFCISRLDHTYVLNKEDFEAVSKVMPSKISLLPTPGCGCTLQKFNPANFSEGEVQKICHGLGLKSSDFVLIFIGRTVYFKGYGMVAKAFLELSKVNRSLKLLVLGDADPLHPTGLTREEELELKANPNCIPLGYKAEVEQFLAVSDLMVFPSVKEGIPVCIMEALAMGVPVLTANSRGCRVLVENGKTGFVLDDCNVQKIERTIEFAFENPDILASMKQRILAQREKLNRRVYVDYQVQLYRSLC